MAVIVEAVIKATDQSSETLKKLQAAAEVVGRGLSQAGEQGSRGLGEIKGAADKAGSAAEAASLKVHKLFGVEAGKTKASADAVITSLEGVSRAATRGESAVTRLRASLSALKEASIMSLNIFAPKAIEALHTTLAAGLDFNTQVVRARAAGLTDKQVNEGQDFAELQAAKYGGLVGKTDAFRSFVEARSVMQDPDEAGVAAEGVVRMKAAMRAVGKSPEEIEQADILVKAAELLGKTKTHKQLLDFIEAELRANQVMGGTIDPTGQYEAVKYARQAGATLSDRFIATTLQSLTQEVGGSSAGNMARMFNRSVVGGHLDHQALQGLVDAGMLTEDDVIRTTTGSIKGLKPGHYVKDRSLAQTDPDKWVYEADDMLRKQGMSDLDITAWWSKNFNSTVADLAVKLTQQRPAFERHAQLYESAAGFGAISLSGSNPGTAVSRIEGGAGNLATDVGANATNKLTGMLNWFANTLEWARGKYNEEAKAHPDAVGWGSVGAIGGAGALAWKMANWLNFGLGGMLRSFGLGGAAGSAETATGLVEASTALTGFTASIKASQATLGSFIAFIPGLVEATANSTNAAQDKRLADVDAKTKELRKRYGDDVLNKARAAYEPWWDRRSLDSGDANDEAYIQRYLKEKPSVSTHSALHDFFFGSDGDWQRARDSLPVIGKGGLGGSEIKATVSGLAEVRQNISVEVGLDGPTKRLIDKAISVPLAPLPGTDMSGPQGVKLLPGTP